MVKIRGRIRRKRRSKICNRNKEGSGERRKLLAGARFHTIAISEVAEA